MNRRPEAAFTLVEILVGAMLMGAFSLMLVVFISTSSRLAARNLITNHGHGAVRGSADRLFHELHSAGSPLKLINYDGASYADVTPALNGDQELLTQRYLSGPANGVRFRRMIDGPYRLSQNAFAGGTTLAFDVSTSTYEPLRVGDKVRLALIDDEFTITAVDGPFAPGATVIVTVSPAIRRAITTGAGFNAAGYFYRMSAFTVWEEKLRFHPLFYDGSRDTVAMVRDFVTSPKPFALLFDTPSSVQTTAVPSLAIRLEAYDTHFGALKYRGNASTLLGAIPLRNTRNTSSSALDRLD